MTSTPRVWNTGCILSERTLADTDPVTTSEFIIAPGSTGFTIRAYPLTQDGTLQLYSKDAGGTERAEGAAIACVAGTPKLETRNYRPGRFLYGKYTASVAPAGIEIHVEGHGA